ncbi:uncharacterized protein LOC21392472 isoform X2 [Morus notabilis]|uniref:uncharacterized protein LOC21392472 isoform X2 n=1 Tax=Morus notabilis TaxID=981085 RepID=UPI000CED72B2|nr:uncharacterized protein LOC21392472 isoform X2 [Morus notabilis]
MGGGRRRRWRARQLRRRFESDPGRVHSGSAELRPRIGSESSFSEPFDPRSTAETASTGHLPTPSSPPRSLPRFQRRPRSPIERSLRHSRTGQLYEYIYQAQLREVTLQEENPAYEKAISSCESKIQEKIQEADLLRRKLEEMEEAEKNLRVELENAETASDSSQSGSTEESAGESTKAFETGQDTGDPNFAKLDELEKKKKELSSMEAIVHNLEKKWSQVQENALKQPSPAQREKILDKQLHSLIEQLAVKQAQAEGLVNEIHIKEMELERLKGLWRRLESTNAEANTARNRFARSTFDKGSAASDYIVEPHQKAPYSSGGRSESQQRLVLLRSAFVLYILVLHILVFVKISF